MQFQLDKIKTPLKEIASQLGYMTTTVGTTFATSDIYVAERSWSPTAAPTSAPTAAPTDAPTFARRRLAAFGGDFGEPIVTPSNDTAYAQSLNETEVHRRLRGVSSAASTEYMVGSGVGALIDEGDLIFDRILFGNDKPALCPATVCPGECSRHGTCGMCGKCNCYTRPGSNEPAWTDHDCSKRTCPMGKAWASLANRSDIAHEEQECSMGGNCDRQTGVCKCFPGYTGKACQRSACPNACNYNGICTTQEFLAEFAVKTYTVPWDSNKEQGCICDYGSKGPDCSLLECPVGADVMGGDGPEKGRECGGRGLCDSTLGMCQCFAGYTGTWCERQTVWN